MICSVMMVWMLDEMLSKSFVCEASTLTLQNKIISFRSTTKSIDSTQFFLNLVEDIKDREGANLLHEDLIL